MKLNLHLKKCSHFVVFFGIFLFWCAKIWETFICSSIYYNLFVDCWNMTTRRWTMEEFFNMDIPFRSHRRRFNLRWQKGLFVRDVTLFDKRVDLLCIYFHRKLKINFRDSIWRDIQTQPKGDRRKRASIKVYLSYDRFCYFGHIFLFPFCFGHSFVISYRIEMIKKDIKFISIYIKTMIHKWNHCFLLFL